MYVTGAYASANLANNGIADPLTRLSIRATAGAAIAFNTLLLQMRTHGHTLLKMTIDTAFILR
jgi:hypothetical protein